MNQETLDIFEQIKEYLNYHKLTNSLECIEAEIKTK